MTIATSLFAEELIPPIEVDPVLVTPGVVGFVVTFAVAIGALLLILDMVKRVRRVRYRAEIAEMLDREEQDAKRSEGSSQ